MPIILPSFAGTAQPAGGGSFSNEYSVDFDGTNDQCNIDLTGLSGATAASFSLWYNKDTSRAYANAFGSGTNGTNFIDIDIRSSVIRFECRSGGSTYVSFTQAEDIGAWHHVVGVFDASATNKLTLYYDGSSVATSTSGPTSLSSTAVANGAIGVVLSNSWFPGLLDEAAVWNSALSASDVTAIYNSGVPADLTSLSPIGWWRMGENDGGTGTTITDQGSGGNNGTLVNGPTFSTTVPS